MARGAAPDRRPCNHGALRAGAVTVLTTASTTREQMASVTFTTSNAKEAEAMRAAAARDSQAWERTPAAGVPVHTTGMTKVN